MGAIPRPGRKGTEEAGKNYALEWGQTGAGDTGSRRRRSKGEKEENRKRGKCSWPALGGGKKAVIASSSVRNLLFQVGEHP